MPTVLIIGSDAPYTLESSYGRAFQKLGWAVYYWNASEALSQFVPWGRWGRILTQYLFIEPWHRTVNETLLRLCKRLQPNLLLTIATTGVQAGTLAQIRVQLPQIVIYCLFPDSPQLLNTERLLCLPLFDRVFTSSPAWVDSFRQLGALQVVYLPFAADTTLFQPIAMPVSRSALTADVQFIGNWRLEREKLLAQLTDYDLRIWGTDYWRKRTEPGSGVRQKWGGRPLLGAEFAQACAESKIMLNIMDAVSWPGPNMRTFELPACGAFALAERSEPVLALFREGETIECFADAAEAREKINFYLAHEDARQRIARAAHAFVTQSGHTYHDRVRTLCDWWAQDKKGVS